MYIYLAHPIDQATPGDTVALARVVAHVQEAANQQGHGLFRPSKAHRLPQVHAWSPEDMQTVDRINRMAIWEADAFIGVVMPGIPSLGVPSEIETALSLNRPTLILTTDRLRATSVQIAAWISRGANCVLVGEDGNLQGINLAGELERLPDPTQLVTDASTVSAYEHPALMVRYQGNSQTLTRGKYEGDAGLDLALSIDVHIPDAGYMLAPTGAHVAIPPGYFGLITGRSSTWANWRCNVRQAVIDSGYRGELMVGIENHRGTAIKFEAGMRLAQMILLPTWSGEVEVTSVLPEHERGVAGYGSSGL